MNALWSRWRQNWLVGAALTAADEMASRPAQNAVATHLALAWRAPAVATHLDADCGAPRPFRVFGLFGLRNVTASAQVRVTLSAEAGGAELYDSAWMAMEVARGFDQWTLALEEAIAARHVRLAIADPDNADGFLDIGLAWAGDGFAPTRNPVWGLAGGHDDPSLGQAVPGGQSYIDRRRLVRSVAGFYANLPREEALGPVWDLALEGTRETCLLVPRPNHALAPREAIAGLLQKSSRLSRDFPAAASWSFEIRERL